MTYNTASLMEYKRNKTFLSQKGTNSMDNIEALYSKPLPSSRSGAFYNTFPYPTKISPEAIAVYIACSTNPGDLVLDAFAGSGSTGVAALLCEHPTERMREIAKDLNVTPVWGARNAVLYEIGTYASFAIKTILSRLSSREFTIAVDSFLKKAQDLVGGLYEAIDLAGDTGTIRYVIWSEVLECPSCHSEISYFEHGTSRDPVRFKDEIVCPYCKKVHHVEEMPFTTEEHYDRLLHKQVSRKKRVPAWIYGTTNGYNWDRQATEADAAYIAQIESTCDVDDVPQEIQWGELHRAGYHYGITHLHHFYTARNYIVMSKLWKLAETYPEKISDALKLLLLSYNASHCTLMTRVVAKKNAKDFILTSAQSGVLYISKLPVEKNILLGLKRKVKPFAETYAKLQNCTGQITIHNGSSTKMKENNDSIDFVFTDPPFGDFIPYAEVNQINELWLPKVTNRKDEVIISASQGKDVFTYQELLTQVFSEINRVLKPNHYASIVFHAAKAKVWDAFSEAITGARLQIVHTNILDKTQASFKQVVSDGSVQGDPLFLLKKSLARKNTSRLTDEEVLHSLLVDHISDPDFDNRKCFSWYINRCLELGIDVTMDAKQVYEYYDSQKRAK
ncbi:MAG: DNA methyltransferase [Agathobacter sp.]